MAHEEKKIWSLDKQHGIGKFRSYYLMVIISLAAVELPNKPYPSN